MRAYDLTVTGSLIVSGSTTLTGDITYDDLTATGDIVTTGANKVISGSSTSTGSFGALTIPDYVTIGSDTEHTVALRIAGNTSQHILLHLQNSSYGASIRLQRADGSTTGLLGSVNFGNRNTDDELATMAAYADGSTTNASLRFYTEATGEGLSERMRITSTGNVGIGTTSPTRKFHVEGDALVTGVLTAQEFHTEYVSASEIMTSGSTRFCDSKDDEHQYPFHEDNVKAFADFCHDSGGFSIQ